MKYFINKVPSILGITTYTFAFIIATVTSQTVAQSLEQQVKQLESQLQAIQKQLNDVRSASVQEAQKVEEIEELAISAKKSNERKKNMIFFRGGFAHSMHNRNGVTIQSNVAPVGAQEQADKDAWYIGAGFDFGLTEDAWGLMPHTEVMAELMFEYKQFGANVKGNALANSPTQLAGGGLNPRSVTVSQLTLSAAPKIKFMEGSKLRPWIIPAGLAIHVISPPSESITVFIPGVMFAAGADYNIWKDFYIGADARYHVTSGKVDGVNIDGLTAGGYLGIGF